MNKKNKILVTFLTAACTAVSAFGFTACKPQEEPPETFKPIEYVGKAIDDKGNPIENVWLAIGYSVESVYKQLAYAKTEANGEAKFKTVAEDSKNFENNEFISVENVTAYELRLVDPMTSSFPKNQRTVPYSYVQQVKTETGTSADGDKYTYVVQETFNSSNTATLTFNYVPNNYFQAEKHSIVYSRSYKDYVCEETDDNIIVNSEDYVVNLTKGNYNYFYFSPYVNPPSASEQDFLDYPKDQRASLARTETQKRINRAGKSASGKYAISFETDPSASVTMYYYGNVVFNVDKDGIPQYPSAISGQAPEGANNADVYTGSSKIELLLNSEIVRGNNIFGIVAEKDCSVTVKVERLGEAKEVVTNVKDITIESDEIQKQANVLGTLTSLNTDEYLNGTTPIVKGTDGYWHVGNADGPLVYVNLAKQAPHISADQPLNMLHKQQVGGGGNLVDRGESAYSFTVMVDEYTREQYNFYNLVTKYTAEKCNKDGMYVVTDKLYQFLSFYGNVAPEVTVKNDNNWLIPCYYYKTV